MMEKHVFVFILFLALITSPTTIIQAASTMSTAATSETGQTEVQNSTATITTGLTTTSNNLANTNSTASTTTTTTTTSTSTTTTTTKLPQCSNVESYCLQEIFGNPDLSISNVNPIDTLTFCRRDMYLNYCIQNWNQRCKIYKRNYKLTWFNELCRRVPEFMRVSRCQVNQDILTECRVALQNSEYNDSSKYKIMATTGNTCLYEQLYMKCEAISRWDNGPNCRGFLEIYQTVINVIFNARLSVLNCRKYVDVPCRYRIGFKHDLC